MIKIKTPEQIEQMKAAGALSKAALRRAGSLVRPGATTLEIDQVVEGFIRLHSAVPTFKGYGGFPGSICSSVNEQIVHGIPSQGVVLQEGDIVSIDTGATYRGWVGDNAWTFYVGTPSEEWQVLCECTRDCLKAAKVIRMDGLDLWGRWKVRPAVTKVGDDIYIAILDEDDALHLFKKASLTNVKNCGKIMLQDGMYITGHRPLGSGASATEQGDAKLQFTDWDGDGDPDLLVGVTSVASWPSEMNGIPYSLGTQNMQVMILENVSDDGGFVFGYPRLFQYQGDDLFLGEGSKAPVECEFGDSRRGSNMLIGTDDGKLWFFARHDLSEKRIW